MKLFFFEVYTFIWFLNSFRCNRKTWPPYIKKLCMWSHLFNSRFVYHNDKTKIKCLHVWVPNMLYFAFCVASKHGSINWFSNEGFGLKLKIYVYNYYIYIYSKTLYTYIKYFNSSSFEMMGCSKKNICVGRL